MWLCLPSLCSGAALPQDCWSMEGLSPHPHCPGLLWCQDTAKALLTVTSCRLPHMPELFSTETGSAYIHFRAECTSMVLKTRAGLYSHSLGEGSLHCCGTWDMVLYVGRSASSQVVQGFMYGLGWKVIGSIVYNHRAQVQHRHEVTSTWGWVPVRI